MNNNLIQVIGSSTIDAYGFDYMDGTLTVKFLSGQTYEYENVPSSVWRAWQSAPSKGRFFHESIKDQYTTKKDILNVDPQRNEIRAKSSVTVARMGKVRIMRYGDGEMAAVVNVVTGDVELSERAVDEMKGIFRELAKRAG